jgi:hypothetical protein
LPESAARLVSRIETLNGTRLDEEKLMTNHAIMKLGKHAPRHDRRTLKLADYLRPKVNAPKPAVDWSELVARWGMMQNDSIGDCTCAAAGHMIEVWTSQARPPSITVPDQEIIAAYSAISGYDRGNPATDQGAIELDVLKYWRTTGIGAHRILAFAGLEPGELDHVKISVELFGGCYVGLALPISAQTQSVWSLPPGGPTGNAAPGSWGGHAVPVVAYDPFGLTVVTWGMKKRMTWSFWRAYCDEAYAILSEDWINSMGVNPEGFALGQLNADLAGVTNASGRRAA